MASVTGMHWNMSFWAALMAVLLASWPGLAMSTTDQERPNVAPKSCWLPASLGSFQGKQITTASVGSANSAFAPDWVVHQPDFPTASCRNKAIMVILICLIKLRTNPQMLTLAMDCAGTYHCSSFVMILECGTTEEIAGIVQHYTLVEEVGVGHSQ